MAKKIYYEPNAKLTEKLIEKLDNDPNIFWRFQGADWEISGEHEESWGMIYSSREEAIQDWMDNMECSYEEAEAEAILPGKSCMPTFKETISFYSRFDSDFVLMAFEGSDTGATGHDGEYVATFYEPVAIFSYDDAIKYAETHIWK